MFCTHVSCTPYMGWLHPTELERNHHILYRLITKHYMNIYERSPPLGCGVFLSLLLVYHESATPLIHLPLCCPSHGAPCTCDYHPAPPSSWPHLPPLLPAPIFLVTHDTTLPSTCPSFWSDLRDRSRPPPHVDWINSVVDHRRLYRATGHIFVNPYATRCSHDTCHLTWRTVVTTSGLVFVLPRHVRQVRPLGNSALEQRTNSA